MRVMASSIESVFEEAALGMLEAMTPSMPEAVHVSTGEWWVHLHEQDGDTGNDVLLLAWLDEVLFRAQHEHAWLIDVSVSLHTDEHGRYVRAAVSHVNGRTIQRSVEIKAVTSHSMMLHFVERGAHLPGIEGAVPDLIGPAWYADVLLDV